MWGKGWILSSSSSDDLCLLFSINPSAYGQGILEKSRFPTLMSVALLVHRDFIVSVYGSSCNSLSCPIISYFLSLILSWHPIFPWGCMSIERERQDLRKRRDKRDSEMNCCTQTLWNHIRNYYIIHTVLQCDLPPLRPHYGEAPRAEIRTQAGRPMGRDTAPRPPHLLIQKTTTPPVDSSLDYDWFFFQRRLFSVSESDLTGLRLEPSV